MSIERWSDLMFPEAGEKDAHLWGSVKSVNSDGSYEVQLNTSSVTTRCAPCCTAGVGDRVLVCIMANGRCVAVGRLEGTQAEIAKPVSNKTRHNVNYIGLNPVTSTAQDTTETWGSFGSGVAFNSVSGQLVDQPNQYGLILNATAGSEVHQIWMSQAHGSLFHRGGNMANSNLNIMPWYMLLDTTNTADYVVNKGKSGAWTYRKWASGFAEAFYADSHTLDIANSYPGTNATLWYGGTTLDLPFTFLTIRAVANVAGGNITWAQVSGYNNSSVTVRLTHHSQITSYVAYIGVHAYGTWK